MKATEALLIAGAGYFLWTKYKGGIKLATGATSTPVKAPVFTGTTIAKEDSNFTVTPLAPVSTYVNPTETFRVPDITSIWSELKIVEKPVVLQ
jgi:hypothetical protein